MKKLKIAKISTGKKTFVGHVGRPGKRGGSAARTGAARAVTSKPSKYAVVSAVGNLTRRSVAASALEGVQTGVRKGKVIGGVLGNFIPGIGTLLGSTIGIAAGVQYGSMVGSIKGVVDTAVALNNTSKLGALYHRTSDKALKAAAKETAKEVFGISAGLAISATVRFAVSKATGFVIGRIFERQTGRKWSDFVNFVKQKAAEKRAGGSTYGTEPVRIRIPVSTGLSRERATVSDIIDLKKHKVGGRTMWQKGLKAYDLSKWPRDIVALTDSFETRITDLQAKGTDTSELEDSFWEDMSGVVDLIDQISRVRDDTSTL